MSDPGKNDRVPTGSATPGAENASADPSETPLDPFAQNAAAEAAAEEAAEEAAAAAHASAVRTPAARARRRRRRTGRGVAGVVGLAVVVGSIAVPQLIAFPAVSTPAQGRSIVPVAADGQLVCAGRFVDARDPETLTAITGPKRDIAPGRDTKDAGFLDSPDVSGSGIGTSTVTIPVDTSNTAIVPGVVMSQSVATPDYFGLSSTACTEATADSWLVAGSTDVGNTTVLLLANPSAVAASVDLALYGENGLIEAAGSTGIVVAPATVRAISLAGLAPDVLRPVVRVSARGGEIAASLQSSAISGLNPVGVETTGATASPSTAAVISGFTLSSATPGAATDAGAGADGSPTLRVLAPGSSDATVTVSVTNEDSSGSGTTASVVVPAGRVNEVPLQGLANGSYTVSIQSDQPVVAAARSSSTGNAGTDYAWFAASQANAQPFGVANAGIGDSSLHLYNASDTSSDITVSTGAGSQSYPVGPRTAVTIPLGTQRATVTGGFPLYASVSTASEGLIAAYPIRPPSPLASAVTIYDH